VARTGGRRASKARAGIWRRHVTAFMCAAVLIAAAVAVVAFKVFNASGTAPAAPRSHTVSLRYFGAYEPDAPSTYAGVERFGQAVGKRPNLAGYYSGWDEYFQTRFARAAASHGATTVVQMDPKNISLAEIAAGKYDTYLTNFADEVAAFRLPVVISFGREMNGFWYTWGYHQTPPRVFVAAWRHIVNLFRKRRADNVKWLWQVNSASNQTGPVKDWWPGSQYVTWVGISGYYFLPNETFSYIFTPVLTSIRKFTHDPVLIAETGVHPSSGQAKGIRNLITETSSQHYLGLVWFDQNTPGPLYTGGHWRLESNPTALNAVRSALRGKL
jgi:mannan endo-1,4-beta-mannosidase